MEKFIQDVANTVRYSSSGGLDLTGVYPPICTPFNKDQSIAWDKLDQNMKRYKMFIRNVIDVYRT